MTGPDEPWDFPELTPPDPTSLLLPEAEPEPIYDTGSDGWWRAQAKAQREAAESDPAPLFRPMPPLSPPIEPVAPLELVEPSVLNDPAFLPSGPSPLDDAYLPPEEVFPALADDSLVQPVEQWLAVTGTADAPVEQYAEPESVEAAPEPEPTPVEVAPRQPLLRPLVVPEPSEEWYDAAFPVEEDPPPGVGWRRAAAWAGLAVAGVGLLVVAFLLLGKDEPKGSPTITAPSPVASTGPTSEPSPTPAETVAPTATPAVTASAQPVALAPVVPLTVLNNSKVSHLALQAAARFRAGGWPVPATGNYRGKLETTTIYYPAGQRASAERFAKQFGVRVLPRFAGLPGTGMTVVVTRDFA